MSEKIEETNEEIEDANIEESADIAVDFIYDKILPILDDFEENNENPDYVYGIATHGLFIELIQRLGEMGYTEKDLRSEIKVYLNNSFGQIIH